MRFLTPAEWQKWCTDRKVPLRDVGWIRPDIRAEHLHIADLKYPADSGPKVSSARYLFSLLAKEEETLLLVDIGTCGHPVSTCRFLLAFASH